MGRGGGGGGGGGAGGGGGGGGEREREMFSKKPSHNKVEQTETIIAASPRGVHGYHILLHL